TALLEAAGFRWHGLARTITCEWCGVPATVERLSKLAPSVCGSCRRSDVKPAQLPLLTITEARRVYNAWHRERELRTLMSDVDVDLLAEPVSEGRDRDGRELGVNAVARRDFFEHRAFIVRRERRTGRPNGRPVDGITDPLEIQEIIAGAGLTFTQDEL